MQELLSAALVPVLIDGKETRSCVTPVSAVANQEIATLEGLPARWAKQKGLTAEEAKNTLHPVQQAWIEEQTPLCGYCQNGMMITAIELLRKRSGYYDGANQTAFTIPAISPSVRCGSYVAIIDAVKHPPKSWRGGESAMATTSEMQENVFGATLSRRQF